MKQHSTIATVATWGAIAATAILSAPKAETAVTPTLSGSDFDRAVAFIFSVEGGLSDRPNDAGGRTNMGITQERAAEYGLTPDEITKEKATEIYYQSYWLAAGCDELDWPVSLACLNTSVQSGPGKADEFNQMVGSGTAEDEARAYAERQQDYYDAIVKANPSQSVFDRGWRNRTRQLLSAIAGAI